jgi:hypothetical protein
MSWRSWVAGQGIRHLVGGPRFVDDFILQPNQFCVELELPGCMQLLVSDVH